MGLSCPDSQTREPIRVGAPPCPCPQHYLSIARRERGCIELNLAKFPASGGFMLQVNYSRGPFLLLYGKQRPVTA